MLTKLEARSTLGSLLSINLIDDNDGFTIQDISGLDPVKAVLVSSSFAQIDGEEFQSARREPRDISIKLGLEPSFLNQTIRDLRTKLYSFFMPKTSVELTFYDDSGLVVHIYGIVESFVSPLFTQEPVADIGIRCYKPDFENLQIVTLNGITVPTSFETPVNYAGTVETGIKFTLSPARALTEFSIYQRPPDGTIRTLQFSTPLLAGDKLVIQTKPGAKYATLTRSTQDSSVLYGVSPYSNWIQLLQGTNYIRVYAEGAGIPYKLEYTAKYGGL